MANKETTTQKRAGRMAQVVECLPSKQALVLIPHKKNNKYFTNIRERW
jgi:hypothetical protein